jgi:serine phosphatase RsbU (regulator of sigma subunit)
VEVGGDWYDVIAVDDRHAFLVIGDVSGHGLRAATTMALLRHAVLAYVLAAQDGELPARRLPLVAHAHPYRFTRSELDAALTLLESWCAAPTW